MLSCEFDNYIFSLKELEDSIVFRVWNEDIEDFEIIKIIDNNEVSYEVLKSEIKTFVDNQIDKLKIISKSVEKLGDE